jgi:hypothetical protein
VPGIQKQKKSNGRPIKKASTPSEIDDPAKAKPSRERVRGGETAPMRAVSAYSLDDHWVDKGDQPLDPTAVPLPRHQRDLTRYRLPKPRCGSRRAGGR